MHSLSHFIRPAIAEKVAEIHRLSAELFACLPVECTGHCMVVGRRGAILNLVADSPAWATRVRYHGSEIIRHFNSVTGLNLQRVKVVVGPPVGRSFPRSSPGKIAAVPAAPRTKPRLPVASAKALEQMAKDVDHPELAAALQRLSARRLRHP